MEKSQKEYRIGNDPSRNLVTASNWSRSRRSEVLSEFRKVGERYENSVGRMLVEQMGGEFTCSTASQNMRQHIDIWWTDENGVKHGVDVKMPKKTRRYDTEPDNTRTWVEILNTAGDPGWLDGDEEWIAFVREGGFNEVLFVNRSKLSKFVKDRIKNSKVVEYNTGVSYDLYTRAKWGNNDMCTIVPFSDMEPFVDFRIKFK